MECNAEIWADDELSRAFGDFVVGAIDFKNPEDIDRFQQRILAIFNQEFSDNIKEYVPDYNNIFPPSANNIRQIREER
jgi:hypothetical protein